ncbi:hypothetical protein X975_04241, partial [Stegodyphus mimosarum]
MTDSVSSWTHPQRKIFHIFYFKREISLKQFDKCILFGFSGEILAQNPSQVSSAIQNSRLPQALFIFFNC